MSERSSNTTKIETKHKTNRLISRCRQKEVLTQQRLKPSTLYNSTTTKQSERSSNTTKIETSNASAICMVMYSQKEVLTQQRLKLI